MLASVHYNWSLQLAKPLSSTCVREKILDSWQCIYNYYMDGVTSTTAMKIFVLTLPPNGSTVLKLSVQSSKLSLSWAYYKSHEGRLMLNSKLWAMEMISCIMMMQYLQDEYLPRGLYVVVPHGLLECLVGLLYRSVNGEYAIKVLLYEGEL